MPDVSAYSPGTVTRDALAPEVAAAVDNVSAIDRTIDVLRSDTAVSDRMQAVNGTALSAHTPDLGIVWKAAVSIITITEGVALSTVGNAVALHPYAGTDVEVRATLVLGTASAGIVVRATDKDNLWFAQVDPTGKTLRLYEIAAGVTTSKVSASIPAVLPNTSYAVIVRSYRDLITAEVVGVGMVQLEGITATGTGVGMRCQTTSGVSSFTARRITAPATPGLPTITATNAASPLVLPVMYGDTQGTHPDVLDTGVSGWNGYRYWMAYTPHTGSNTQNENPSITVSNDGTTWTTPPGLTNPLVPWSGVSGDWNSDVDIALVNGTMYLIYRRHVSTTEAILYVMESTNGVTWSTPVAVINSQDTTSPAIIYRDGVWHMWAVYDLAPIRYRIVYRTAPSVYGPWSAPRECQMPMPAPKIDMWHINVVDRGSRFDGVFSSADRTTAGSGIDGNLYFASSYDGINWNLAATPFLFNTADGTSWDDSKLYRSSIVPVSGGYTLYYSAAKTDSTWHIGKTTMALAY